MFEFLHRSAHDDQVTGPVPSFRRDADPADFAALAKALRGNTHRVSPDHAWLGPCTAHLITFRRLPMAECATCGKIG
ncbi:MAG TPA: hypothetical protein VGE37_02545, partial [Archangium sp.]